MADIKPYSWSATFKRGPLFLPAILFAFGCVGGGYFVDHQFAGVLCLYFALPLVALFLILGWWRACPPYSLVYFAAIVFVAGWWHACGSKIWWASDDVRLQASQLEAMTVNWTGAVDSAPDIRKTFVQFYLRARAAQVGQRSVPVSGRILVRLQHVPTSSLLVPDQLIQILATLRPLPPALNPGQLDYRLYQADHGTYYTLSGDYADLIALDEGPKWNPSKWSMWARQWCMSQLTRGLETAPEIVSVLSGMLFGYVAAIPPDADAAFRLTGTYHIFAVSGQNLGELLTLGLLAIQLLGLVRWRWGWVLAPALLFYCLISGNQPSIIRSLIMVAFVLAGWLAGRPGSSLNFWSLSLVLILFAYSNALSDLGYLLSFAVVLGLILGSPPFVPLARRWWQLDPFIPSKFAPPFLVWKLHWGQSVTLLLATSLVAWLASLPLMYYYFHQVSLISIVANLFVVPLAGLIVVTGTLALFSSLGSTWILVLLNNANWLFVKLMLCGVIYLARVPGASFYAAPPSAWITDRGPHLTIACVGPNQVCILRYRGQSWLINSGSETDYRFTIDPLRRFYGINRWDGVVLTARAKPLAGAWPELQYQTPVTEWFVPAYLPPPRSRGISSWPATARAICPGYARALDKDLILTVLGPQYSSQTSKSVNPNLSILLTYKSDRVLIAGNLGFGAEQELLASGALSDVQILIQAFRADEPGLSIAWLNRLKPRYLILAAPSRFQQYHVPLGLEAYTHAFHPDILSQEKVGAVNISWCDCPGGPVVKAFLLDSNLPH